MKLKIIIRDFFAWLAGDTEPSDANVWGFCAREGESLESARRRASVSLSDAEDKLNDAPKDACRIRLIMARHLFEIGQYQRCDDLLQGQP